MTSAANMSPQQPSPDHWTLDKRVPITVLVGFGVQFIAALWLFAQMHSDIEVLKTTDASYETSITDLRVNREALASRITILETKLPGMDGKLDRIEDKLDRIIEKYKMPISPN